MVLINNFNNDIVLGQGRFGVCKLMSLSVSGESVTVAVKHYTDQLTPKEAQLLMKPVFHLVFHRKHSPLFLV